MRYPGRCVCCGEPGERKAQGYVDVCGRCYDLYVEGWEPARTHSSHRPEATPERVAEMKAVAERADVDVTIVAEVIGHQSVMRVAVREEVADV